MAEKKFRAGLYAVISGILIAVILTGLTLFAYTTRYTAFKPEKVAQFYVDTIVQNGDGYNAYKNTLVSKNAKYGDFVRNAYMRPYVNEKDENGEKIKQAEFVGTGSKEETKAIDEVYNTMYDYYCQLINQYGWDNYDEIYNQYFAKLVEVRKAVYGDDFMNYDYMFGALEANVAKYGESLTGTDRVIASDNKTILVEESVGKYQEMFGTEQEVEAENVIDGKKQTVKEKKLVYRFTTTVKDCQELSEADAKKYIEEYKARIAPIAESGEAKAEKFDLKDTESVKKILFIKKTEKDSAKSNMIEAFKKLDCSEDISSVAKVTCEVKLDNGKVVATQELYVVKIGKSWYVDNTNVDTTALYLAE